MDQADNTVMLLVMEQGDQVRLHLCIGHQFRQIAPVVVQRMGDGEVIHGAGGITQFFACGDIQIIAAKCGGTGVGAVKKILRLMGKQAVVSVNGAEGGGKGIVTALDILFLIEQGIPAQGWEFYSAQWRRQWEITENSMG